MASTELSGSVLALKIKDLRFPKHFCSVVEDVVRRTSERVIVLVFCELFNDNATISHTAYWHEIQTLLTVIYTEAARIAQEQEKVLLQVDILFRGTRDVFLLNAGAELDRLFLIDNQEGMYISSCFIVTRNSFMIVLQKILILFYLLIILSQGRSLE